MPFKPVNSKLLSTLAAAVLSLTAARASASAPLSRSSEAVQQYLKTEMESRHIPGMQVAVVQRGRIAFLAAMGVADIDRRVPVTDSPRDDLSVVILTNLQGASPEELLDKVAAFFVPDLSLRSQ